MALTRHLYRLRPHESRSKRTARHSSRQSERKGIVYQTRTHLPITLSCVASARSCAKRGRLDGVATPREAREGLREDLRNTTPRQARRDDAPRIPPGLIPRLPCQTELALLHLHQQAPPEYSARYSTHLSHFIHNRRHPSLCLH